MYGNYAAQPELGLLDRREGVFLNTRLKINPEWMAYGGLRYDLKQGQISGTNLGLGYIDDCLILAVNYMTEYAYNTNSNIKSISAVTMQLTLRTIGGNSVSRSVPSVNSAATGR
jgi:LPS-assembly protein